MADTRGGEGGGGSVGLTGLESDSAGRLVLAAAVVLSLRKAITRRRRSGSPRQSRRLRRRWPDRPAGSPHAPSEPIWRNRLRAWTRDWRACPWSQEESRWR